MAPLDTAMSTTGSIPRVANIHRRDQGPPRAQRKEKQIAATPGRPGTHRGNSARSTANVATCMEPSVLNLARTVLNLVQRGYTTACVLNLVRRDRVRTKFSTPPHKPRKTRKIDASSRGFSTPRSTVRRARRSLCTGHTNQTQ